MAFLKRRDEGDFVRDLMSLHDEINRLFGMSTARTPVAASFAPALDVYEDKNNVVAEVELPGVDAKDVTISVDDDILTIRGTKEEKKREEKEGIVYSERVSGEFFRQVRLPSLVDADKAQASYKNGVLKVTLPRKEEEKKKAITIDVQE